MRPSHRRRAAHALALASALAASTARADPPSPASEAIVARDGSHWSVRVFVRDASGALESARTIAGDAPDCGPITAATVVAVAVALEAHATSPPATPAPTPPAPAATPAAPAPTATPAASPAPTTPARPTPAAPQRPPAARENSAARGASALVRAYLAPGLLPQVAAPGVGVAVEPLVFGRVRLGLTGLFLPEQSTTTTPRIGIGLTALSAGLCVDAVTVRDRLALTGCGAVWLGAIYSVAYEDSPVEPGPRPWVALSVGPRVTVRVVGPLTAELAVDLVVPITAYQFYATRAGTTQTLFESSPAAGLISAGLGVRFW